MEVETKNASLDTLAVTIQALHVSGKQMTLAVFRQLPIAEAYSPSGALTPMDRWGLVRYEIKAQGEVWLVASRDGRLFRCDVYPGFEPLERAAKCESEARTDLLEYKNVEAAEAKYKQQHSDWTTEKDRLEKDCPVGEQGYGHRNGGERNDWIRDRTTVLIDDFSRRDRYGNSIMRATEHYADQADRATKAHSLAAVADASLKQLLELPQLFIAV